ncbi:MAG: hypothetical protein IPP69_11625 [Flavobacteriales bacterium]|nr:hypothetical protein [Flavobacteriales bacterium]
MRIVGYILFYLICIAGLNSFGQLSPGDLTNAHAKLEGMNNCTQCHDLGNSVTNTKCLDCHKEIKELLKQNRGYHSNSQVKSKNCIECHSEHHGRNFQMIRFDEKNFDHNQTTYTLDGKHKTTDCRTCHKPENIENAEIRKLNNTFLGLQDKCLSCHKDFHQGTLDKDCKKCHNTTAFRPAPGFDHNKSDFKLKGGHVQVDCKKCHESVMKNGVEFQVFKPVVHNDCVACHDDPHQEHFKGTCVQCHTDEAFTTFIGKKNFTHDTNTKFKLLGKHRQVDCFQCHAKTKDPVKVFEDRNGVTTNQCATCHEDFHKGKFGNDCAKCHTEKSFHELKSMDFFDHSLTDYPLEGKHVGVDCKKCHKKNYKDPIDFSACKNCHEDFHKGQFTREGIQEDCKECHSIQDGFALSGYSLERHNETDFPLTGAHIATPCFACHVSEEKWTFTNLNGECVACHDNVHGNDFAMNGVTDCKRCHETETWYPSLFDHNLTKFKLEGEHANVACEKCHLPAKAGEKISFKIPKFECIDCHK